MNKSIFKAYDIRGVYPDEIDGDAAYKIGRAFVQFLKGSPRRAGALTLVVSRDARTSSPELAERLLQGLLDEECHVIDTGLATTPLHYFAINHLAADGGVMVTASHNPAKFNGFKLFQRGAVAVGEGMGMEEVRNTACRGIFEHPAARQGTVEKKDILSLYIDFLLSQISSEKIKGFRVALDLGNGMGGLVLPRLIEKLPIHATLLFETIDMTFPNHEANPMKQETLTVLKDVVHREQADIGVAFDGDGDRVGFIDARGRSIPGDHITALLACYLLQKSPGEKIVYDLRSSRVVPEIITAKGSVPLEERVGHAFIKSRMRRENAIFGGEVSGHYYFRNFFFAESAALTFLYMLDMLSQSEKSLEELARSLSKYAQSGEVNFDVADKDAAIDKIAAHYKDALRTYYLDGLSVEYPDFWFNIRPSNTESLLRLNLEARTKEIMERELRVITQLLHEQIRVHF